MRQGVVVRGPGRRFRIVLREPQPAFQKEGIESRGRARIAEPRPAGNQALLPIRQTKLGADRRVGHRRFVRGAEGSHHAIDSGSHGTMLFGREEPWPQDGTDRAISEKKISRAKLRLQLLLRRLRELVGQETVIRVDRIRERTRHGAERTGVREGATAAELPTVEAWPLPPNSACQRISRACGRGSRASRMARSAMRLTTHSK